MTNANASNGTTATAVEEEDEELAVVPDEHPGPEERQAKEENLQWAEWVRRQAEAETRRIEVMARREELELEEQEEKRAKAKYWTEKYRAEEAAEAAEAEEAERLARPEAPRFFVPNEVICGEMDTGQVLSIGARFCAIIVKAHPSPVTVKLAAKYMERTPRQTQRYAQELARAGLVMLKGNPWHIEPIDRLAWPRFASTQLPYGLRGQSREIILAAYIRMREWQVHRTFGETPVVIWQKEFTEVMNFKPSNPTSGHKRTGEWLTRAEEHGHIQVTPGRQRAYLVPDPKPAR